MWSQDRKRYWNSYKMNMWLLLHMSQGVIIKACSDTKSNTRLWLYMWKWMKVPKITDQLWCMWSQDRKRYWNSYKMNMWLLLHMSQGVNIKACSDTKSNTRLWLYMWKWMKVPKITDQLWCMWSQDRKRYWNSYKMNMWLLLHMSQGDNIKACSDTKTNTRLWLYMWKWMKVPKITDQLWCMWSQDRKRYWNSYKMNMWLLLHMSQGDNIKACSDTKINTRLWLYMWKWMKVPKITDQLWCMWSQDRKRYWNSYKMNMWLLLHMPQGVNIKACSDTKTNTRLWLYMWKWMKVPKITDQLWCMWSQDRKRYWNSYKMNMWLLLHMSQGDNIKACSDTKTNTCLFIADHVLRFIYLPTYGWHVRVEMLFVNCVQFLVSLLIL